MSSGTAALHLLFIVVMLGLLTGGTVGLLALWYLRGRDPHVGKHAEFVTEPPDDLPPGAVGTLLDEHAHHEDVVATLLGLAHQRAISIEETGSGASARPGHFVAHDYQLTIENPELANSRVQQQLLHILFPQSLEPGTRTLLSAVKPAFDAAEPLLRDALYEEMEVRGYFRESPAKTRQRWRRLAWFGLITSVVVGLFLTIRVDPFAILATVAAVAIFFALTRLSRVMPQKTQKGAETAEQWRGFRRYLESLLKRKDLAEARHLFDPYFAYAVAFGLQTTWVRRFAEVGARSPAWFGPDGGGTVAGDVGDAMGDVLIFGNLGGSPDVNLPDFDVGMPDVSMPDVDVQVLSDVVGGGVQAASEGLGGLLDAASGIFDAIDFDIFG